MPQIPLAPDVCAFISYIVQSAYRMLFVNISFKAFRRRMFDNHICLC